ncbi:MAG: hypothetical protein GXP25_11060 [Planctomycetes bacterium]|nr:hypothetical protein [Planctomycetota bacterium]
MTRRSFGILAIAILLMPRPGRADEKPAAFKSFFRHEHFFLVWNDQKKSPTFTLITKRFGKYHDGLSYQVIDAESNVLAEGQIPYNSKRNIAPLPFSPKYLIAADPGYNGMTMQTDRPYGIVGSKQHPLGLNHPTGRLFLYVPAGCTEFTIVAKSASPREGAWVKVLRPDGQLAGEAEGELDGDTPIKITVPDDCRGKVWAVEFDKPKTPNVGLDDLNLFVEGKLAPLFIPKKEWAERYGKTVKM